MDFEAFEDMLVENDVVERTVVERPDHFNLFSDTDFYKRYHLKKETVLQLLERIEPLLEADANRNNPISPRLQILATLRILTGCTLQHVCGDLHHIAQSSASRTFSRVVKAICHLRQDFIRMPVNISGVKNSFYEYGGFPGVIACVDGTHIPIIRPKHRAETEVFRCRKGYYSLNVQIVCGPEYLIYDVVARWPGSTHDSRVLENSNIRHYMETANPGLLLADAGYPCRRYILTPLRTPVTVAERHYNRCHIKTRNCVERTIGILKNRFGCLSTKLRYQPEVVGNIVVACCILHNLAVLNREPNTYEPDPQGEEPAVNIIADGAGNAFRRALIDNYFT